MILGDTCVARTIELHRICGGHGSRIGHLSRDDHGKGILMLLGNAGVAADPEPWPQRLAGNACVARMIVAPRQGPRSGNACVARVVD